MQPNENTNKIYFDTQRNKYRVIEKLSSNTNSVSLKTEDGKVLKIYSNLSFESEYYERLEWLHCLYNKSELSNYIALPSAILTGLKYGELGYVCEVNKEVNLNYYILKNKSEKLFKWYFDKTGGIDYRLKIGYILANSLESIHKLGFCLVDISPENTMINIFDTENTKPPSIQFSGAENICSYTYQPLKVGNDLYCDPLVFLNRSTNSTSSDTYSYAIMLFELLTTCHPFIGEDCDELSEMEICEKVNTGSLDYIDDNDKDNNKNEIYEDTQFFLSKELSSLFYKMFVLGRLDSSKRPSLEELKNACLKSMEKIIKCDHIGCKREYAYNSMKKCPFCNYTTQRVITATVKKSIHSTKELLLPYDNIKGFSSLPVIEEDIDFMIIRSGSNKVVKSLFNPNIKLDKNMVCILILHSVDKNKILIRNCFSELKIYVGGKELAPYSKADKGVHSDAVFPDNILITIELPDNAQLESEKIAELEEKEYGIIKYKWILTIE